MVKYENGKVYKIEAINAFPDEKVYVGSTTKQYLSQRMDTHRYDYNKWKVGKAEKTTSFDLFEKYGIENCRIILLEICPCTTKEELYKREAHYIKELNCINKNIPLRTWKERREVDIEGHKEYMKKYRDENKDKIKETKKDYNAVHSIQIKAYQRDYRITKKETIAVQKKIYDKDYQANNSEAIKAKRKEFYEKNKDNILNKQSEKITCSCGAVVSKGSKSRHEKTKIHIAFIQNNK
jgi:hypothetical protein